MKKVLFLFFTLFILTGCQEVGNQADELGSEFVESGEVLEAEVEKTVQNMNDELDQTVENVDKKLISDGEEAVIGTDTLFPVNDEAYDQLFSYLEQPDYTKIEEMREAESIKYVEADTRVEVLDADVIRSKVSIKSSGQEGYIPTKFLEQVSS